MNDRLVYEQFIDQLVFRNLLMGYSKPVPFEIPSEPVELISEAAWKKAAEEINSRRLDSD